MKNQLKLICGVSLILAVSIAITLSDSIAKSSKGKDLNNGLNLKTNTISVSGLSSGGYMANQLHLAFSDWINRVGIIAAGPYYCAQNSIKTALEQCVNKSNETLKQQSITAPLAFEVSGQIAPLSNLKHSRVWLLRGTKDKKIHPIVTNALHNQYANWVAPENMQYIQDKPFAHHFPTLNDGQPCTTSASPFLGQCDYDAAGEMLNFLFQGIATRTDQPKGKVLEFNQQQLGGEAAESLAELGYAYVPQSCLEGESCEVHVNFHGCQQNAETIGQAYINHNGLNNWADNNHLVILYPQTKNSMFMPLNPQGCWDWWGYTGDNYATKEGPQVKAIKQMVLALNDNLVEPN
ncbi:extracellular catalytic domain type 2 short-chain-length polyhydroxyalkanoate depolymerase [Paraglaciecola aestuariivivens]